MADPSEDFAKLDINRPASDPPKPDAASTPSVVTPESEQPPTPLVNLSASQTLTHPRLPLPEARSSPEVPTIQSRGPNPLSATHSARRPSQMAGGGVQGVVNGVPVRAGAGGVAPSPPGSMRGLPANIQERMLAFQQSRSARPSAAGTPSTPASPSAQQRLPPQQRPQAHNWVSEAGVPGAPQLKLPGAGPVAGGGLKMPPGGLAARRKGGLKLADAMGSAAPKKEETAFSNFSKYVNAENGSLNFAGKAVISSEGVNFSTGESFKISMNDLTLLEELGKGNYGTVHRVLHKPTNVTMALKEVRLELDESKFSQIIMELDILHKAISPQIVEFYGAFFVETCVYICMEYMSAGSIDKLYGDGIPEDVLGKITLAMVKGLKVLKDDHNIIHRDVKPTNVLVNEKGIVKLCDFGVSGNLVASIAKTNIGCQSYMAPERIKAENAGQITYTVHSDIWSLGLSMLEMAKGGYPYDPSTYNNIFAQLQAIVDGEPPELPEDFSEDAKDFVRQCLNKSPRNRPNYAQLLRHPWLQRWETEEVDMAGWVKRSLEAREKAKKEGVKEEKPKPALHKVDLLSTRG
ncbi:MAP kinase kinase Wis1 [Saitoella coloradoensis]